MKSRLTHFVSHPVVNLILFQMGWFACVLGASYQYFGIGLIITLAIWSLHVSTNAMPLRELQLILIGGGIGIVNETLLILLNVYEPQRWIVPDPFSPIWLVFLWMNVAITLNGCLSILQPRLWLAALLAAGAGPLAFLAGEALGALDINEPKILRLSVLSLFWLIVFPIFVWIAKRGKDPLHTNVE